MAWHRDHAEIPVFVLALYLAFIFNVPKYMENRKPFELRPILAVWNLSLAVFSAIGAYRMIPFLWQGFNERGLQYVFFYLCNVMTKFNANSLGSQRM